MGGVQSALGVGKKAPEVHSENFFEYSAKDAQGNTIDFAKFKDKVVLVANVASL